MVTIPISTEIYNKIRKEWADREEDTSIWRFEQWMLNQGIAYSTREKVLIAQREEQITAFLLRFA